MDLEIDVPRAAKRLRLDLLSGGVMALGHRSASRRRGPESWAACCRST
jgi:hypothetical protein